MSRAVLIVIAIASCANTVELDESELTFAKCQVLELDQHYRCPSQALAANAELVFIRPDASDNRAVHAATLQGTTFSDAYMFAEPAGWRVETVSISPARDIVLATMHRPDCPTSWPSSSGTSCSWGRNVLWSAVRRQDSAGVYYDLVNLAAYYGRNSHIVGWHTWLTTKKALLNAKIVPDGVDINPDPQHGTGFAYTIDFELGATALTVKAVTKWGGTINNDHCFVGRMHASMPWTGFGTSCGSGQKVVFARRCYDDPVGPQSFSWFNTVNYDGSGGLCHPQSVVGPATLVPAFKNYVVQLDSACNPIAFDRNAPIRQPDYTGRYRHMGTNPEWGDGQPTISLDGSVVAFWSKKSSSASNSVNNCAAFESEDGTTLGNGADRVRACTLDGQNHCATLIDLPAPTNPWSTQGGAYFQPLDNGHPGVLTSESDGGYVTDLVTRIRTRVMPGFGGYPVMPSP